MHLQAPPSRAQLRKAQAAPRQQELRLAVPTGPTRRRMGEEAVRPVS